MSQRFVLGRENVPFVAEVVNRSLKADCTDFTHDNLFHQGYPDKILNPEVAPKTVKPPSGKYDSTIHSISGITQPTTPPDPAEPP